MNKRCSTSNRQSARKEEEASPELNLRKVYDFALTAPLDEIRFILDTARLNKAAAEQAFKGNYGHSLGKCFGELMNIK